MPAFLSDWTFWSFVAAGAAVLLSQLPPVRLWFMKAKLEFEIQSVVYLSHNIGHPIFQVYVSLINTGGRSVRIHDIQLSITRTEQQTSTLPIQGYFQNRDDKQSIFFVPFASRPGGEWAHTCIFSPDTTREQERHYRRAKSALQTNINDKILVRNSVEKMAAVGGANLPVRGGLVEADENALAPFTELFDQTFSMVVGEYRMTVTAVTDKLNISNQYDFTIFESDETDLRDIVKDYKFGKWITWDDVVESKFLRIPIRETSV